MDETDGATVVSMRHGDDGVTVVITGELDLATAGEFIGALEALEPLAAPVTIDLGELAFIDSVGLRALLTAREQVEQSTDCRLRLVGVGDDHFRLLELCGLVDAFDIRRREP